MKEKEIKDMVREKYGELAVARPAKKCCCGTKQVYTIMSDSYQGMEGYEPDADMGLGCGLPTRFALLKPGDTVLDLGSGAGNDCFVARAEVGETGRVIGIDFTPEMVARARENAAKRGYDNVEFIQGDIERMPLGDNVADVVVSNCVLNLVPNKAAVFAEIFRVMKPGGHFSISDIVLTGDLPEKIKTPASMYAGCVASAIDKWEYLGFIEKAGFVNLKLQKEKPIIVPDEILADYLTASEIAAYKASPTVIFSITVYAEKPGSANWQQHGR